MFNLLWARARAGLVLILLLLMPALSGVSHAERMPPQRVLQTWYRLVLELVRHTSNYSPPVAARSFAYIGVTVYEAAAGGDANLQTLAGQLNGLDAVPKRESGAVYDDAVVLNAAMAYSMKQFFSHTGPTGQHAFAATEKKMHARVSDGLPDDVVKRSTDYGQAVAEAILEWSKSDGGNDVQNMGFPLKYDLNPKPGHWVPTSLIRQQQVPLLPDWGKTRPFAMPKGSSCRLPPPIEYSEEKGSPFYKEAEEVYIATKSLTKEQKTIARFWSDDPMLSPTPPGHWVSVAWEIMEKEKSDLPTVVDTMARLGVAVADGFIGCWDSKFEYDLIRPVSYIKKVIDPKWETLLITPPFPEYPSGHSSQSGAAAAVLASIFGENYAFEDSTHVADNIPARTFPSFKAAAEEAAISRLYGGIHFRAAIERGLEQGYCIGAYTVALKTRK